MVPDELKTIIAKFGFETGMSFLDGASEEQIINFEEENSISLPMQYKAWLQFSDGGELFLPAGVQLYGVAHKPVINVDDNDRPDENYIVIGRMSFGDPILCHKTGEEICIYNHGAGVIEEDEKYSDFFSFLNDLWDVLGIGGK